MFKSEFEFRYKHTNEFGNVDMENSSKSSEDSWMELTQSFVYFLRGCGFQVDDQQFAYYVREEFGYAETADSLDMEDI